jgi:hypothetical protein
MQKTNTTARCRSATGVRSPHCHAGLYAWRHLRMWPIGRHILVSCLAEMAAGAEHVTYKHSGQIPMTLSQTAPAHFKQTRSARTLPPFRTRGRGTCSSPGSFGKKRPSRPHPRSPPSRSGRPEQPQTLLLGAQVVGSEHCASLTFRSSACISSREPTAKSNGPNSQTLGKCGRAALLRLLQPVCCGGVENPCCRKGLPTACS